ncbi:M91 family zinc metallopeptidase [Fluviicola sp.]|uniref:M91 family zinc metallopeptidase n=1 Tax=Fluviicola sp. TaxID=1917219 RepID=UPI0026165AF0|nr:M91 family zinc metallopeptidase [Fluviicola sp.]
MMIRTTQKRVNKTSSTLADVPKRKASGKSDSKFADNRPESLTQRKLQESIQSTSQLFQTGGELLRSADQKNAERTVTAENNDQPIQCVLRSRGVFENGLTPEQAQQQQLGIIAGNLGNYHQIDPGADLDFQLRLGALKALLSSIHEWFDQFKTGDMNAVTNTIYLKTVYAEAEQEHRDLIAQISQTQHLPVNTQGMQNSEVVKITRIWTDLLAGSGNLEIRETAQGFRNRMLAAFARLLEGQFGRNMLEDLNTDRGGGEQKIIVGDHFGNEMGDKERPESEAIPISSTDPLRENNHKMNGSSGDDARQDLPGYDEVGDHFDPEDFHDFLIGNDQSNLLKWGNEARKKGTGTGSYVRIAQDGGGYNIGENDSQVIMPEFVTLGHELGHAQRLLRGAPLHGEQITDMGVTDEADKLLWNNPEEYVNINAVENRIRDEHSLSKRKYHVGDMNSLRFERNRAQFTTQYTDWLLTLSSYQKTMLGFHPVGQIVRDYQSVKPNWADLAVLQLANNQLLTLQQDVMSQTDMWTHAALYLQQNPNQVAMTRVNMRYILPYISNDVLNLVPVGVANEFVRYYVQNENNQYRNRIIAWIEINNNYEPLIFAINQGIAERFLDENVLEEFYLQDNRSVNYLSQLLTVCRNAGEWELVRVLMKRGKAMQIRFFELGLTHTEFERFVDPNLDINVEIEYDTTNPKAWFFKNTHHIYVRKNMKAKKD